MKGVARAASLAVSLSLARALTPRPTQATPISTAALTALGEAIVTRGAVNASQGQTYMAWHGPNDNGELVLADKSRADKCRAEYLRVETPTLVLSFACQSCLSRPVSSYRTLSGLWLGTSHGSSGVLFNLLQDPVLLANSTARTLIAATLEHLLAAQLPSGNFPAEYFSETDDVLVQVGHHQCWASHHLLARMDNCLHASLIDR